MEPNNPTPESSNKAQEKKDDQSKTDSGDSHSWRFWCVFLSMCLISFICSIDTTIIVTALSTVSRAIGGEEHYIWIANSFIFGSTAPQPLFAQVSNLFGRRNPFIVAISLFALGSGLAGGATNVAMLIAGRAIQGVGAGGTYVLLDVILCDMVPLRERGKYLGFMLSTAAIGTTVGPVIGGGLAQANWRWIFYLNLPFSALALAFILVFLNLNYTPNPTWKQALKRVDLLGNLIFVPSILAVLFGLTFGGSRFPWSSYHIILPLVLGFAGWILFHIHQASSLCKEPSVPPRVLSNRTSAVGYLLTLISGMVLQAIVFDGQFDRYSSRIGDAAVQAQLANGAAYGYASGGYIRNLSAGVKERVIDVYVDAIQTVWQVTLAFALFGFLSVFAERHIVLRTELETEYGLKEGKQKDKDHPEKQGQEVIEENLGKDHIA